GQDACPGPPCAPQLSVSTIFDFPEVIDHMPGHAPDRVTGVPTPGDQRLAAGGLREHSSDPFPHGFEGAFVVHLEGWASHPDLARICSLGFDDVVPYAVSVSTSTSRTFAQFRRRSHETSSSMSHAARRSDTLRCAV